MTGHHFIRGHRLAESAPSAVVDDRLLRGLVGAWRLAGLVGRRQVEYVMRGYWVLDHQFLRLGVKHPSYRATVHIGHDHVRNHLVAHWLDTMGGRAASTLGFGQSAGAALLFVFRHASGESHATFTFDARGRPRTLLVLDSDEHDSAREVAHFTISALARRVPPAG